MKILTQGKNEVAFLKHLPVTMNTIIKRDSFSFVSLRLLSLALAGIIPSVALGQSGTFLDIPADADYIDENSVYEGWNNWRAGIEMGGNSSYTGDNIKIVNDFSTASNTSYGILSSDQKAAKYLNLKNSEVTVTNTNTSTSANSVGVKLSNMHEICTIANTTINMSARGGKGIVLEAYGVSRAPDTSKLEIIDSHINLTNMNGTMLGAAVIAKNDAAKDSVGIEMKNGSISVDGDGSGTVFYCQLSNTHISATGTKITSRDGNTLAIGNGEGKNKTVSLTNVDLTDARNQVIKTSSGGGDLTVNFDRTHFHGYAQVGDYSSNAEILINLTNGAGWTVTRESNLNYNPTSQNGSLSLDGTSSIIFETDGDGDFFNINAATVMLAEGSILKLDIMEEKANSMIGDETQFQLFGNLRTFYENNGALMQSADGTMMFEYEAGSNGNGWFVLTGMTHVIPEPSSAVLGLFGLSVLALRRRK